VAQGAGPAAVGLILLAACSAPRAEVPIAIDKPDGPGPFPAVVMLHDCSGLGPGSSGAPGRWAKALVALGYVVALPDSFATRGYPQGVCTVQSGARGARDDVSARRRVDDAVAALAKLRTLSYVDAKRVGVMGGSHGGTTTLAVLGSGIPGFSAGVALYPRCSTASQDYAPSAALLILIGERDDWTPAKDCVRLASERVQLKIYPGAQHSFDSNRPERYVAARINPSVPGGRGATTGGNAQAWRDAVAQVTAFFALHLKGER